MSPLVKKILGCLLGIAATLIHVVYLVVMKTRPKIYQTIKILFFKEPISNKIKQPIKETKEVIDTIDKEQEAIRRGLKVNQSANLFSWFLTIVFSHLLPTLRVTI